MANSSIKGVLSKPQRTSKPLWVEPVGETKKAFKGPVKLPISKIAKSFEAPTWTPKDIVRTKPETPRKPVSDKVARKFAEEFYDSAKDTIPNSLSGASDEITSQLPDEIKDAQFALVEAAMRSVPRTIRGPNGKFIRNPEYRGKDDQLTGASE